MVNLITTLGGWALLGVVSCIYYWRYTSERARRRGPPMKVEKRKPLERIDSVSELDAAMSSGAEKPKNRKNKEKAQTKPSLVATGSAADTTPNTTDSLPESSKKSKRGEADDMAFARQLASAQAGTDLKAPERHNTQVRTNKIRQPMPGVSHESLRDADRGQSSGPGSSAGADGDDDLSPHLSPNLAAALSASDAGAGSSAFEESAARTGQDAAFADMLEAPATGPSTLRLIPSDKPQRPTAPKQPKKVEETETKKQRQRRKKKEAEKEQRADGEAERRKLMERQMKTARTADGTAKSGQYRAYTAPTTNAWNGAKEAVEETAKKATELGGQLLDTFHPREMPTATGPGIAKGGESETAEAQLDPPSDASRASMESEPGSVNGGSGNGGYSQDPVIADASSSHGERMDSWEDYQMRALRQQDKANDNWQEVAPRKGKKGVAVK